MSCILRAEQPDEQLTLTGASSADASNVAAASKCAGTAIRLVYKGAGARRGVAAAINQTVTWRDTRHVAAELHTNSSLTKAC